MIQTNIKKNKICTDQRSKNRYYGWFGLSEIEKCI